MIAGRTPKGKLFENEYSALRVESVCLWTKEFFDADTVIEPLSRILLNAVRL